MSEEKPTEERLQDAIDLYETDMESWDVDIYLDELERLYSMRERINKIIFQMKETIREALN